MKKTLILLASVALIASCNNEDLEMPESKGEIVKINFTATNGTSRTTINNGTSEWLQGDQIKIFNGKNATNATDKEVVTAAASESGANVVFPAEIKKCDTGEKYYAVYPASATTGISNGQIQVTLPVNQKAVANGYDPNAILAVACTDNNAFQFKNVTSLLKITVSQACKKLVIAGNTSIAGRLGVSLTNDGSGINTVLQDVNQNTITVKGDINPGNYYLVALRPGKYEHVVVFAFKDDDDESDYLMYTTLFSPTFERNKIKTVNLTK